MVDEELAKWLGTPIAGGNRSARPAGRDAGRPDRRLRHRRASANRPACRGHRAAPTTRALEAWLAERLAEAPARREAPAEGARRRRACRSRGIGFDTALAAWLLRPGSKPDSLGGQVYHYLGETLPEPDPNQLVPEIEALSPATEAWYVRAARRASSTRASTPARCGVEPTSSCRSCRCSPAWSCRASPCRPRCSASSIRGSATQAAELAQQAYAEIGHEVNLGSPKQLQEVLFDRARHAEDPREQDRLLDRRAGPRRPAGAAPASVPRPAAAAPRRHEAPADRRDARDGDRRRRPHAHHLRPDRLHHRPHLVERPEPAEHPGEDRGGPRDPVGVRARRGVRDAAHRRLLADRDAHHGAPLGRRGPHRGVPRRGRTCTASSARASSASTRPMSRPPCAPR